MDTNSFSLDYNKWNKIIESIVAVNPNDATIKIPTPRKEFTTMDSSSSNNIVIKTVSHSYNLISIKNVLNYSDLISYNLPIIHKYNLNPIAMLNMLKDFEHSQTIEIDLLDGITIVSNGVLAKCLTD